MVVTQLFSKRPALFCFSNRGFDHGIKNGTLRILNSNYQTELCFGIPYDKNTLWYGCPSKNIFTGYTVGYLCPAIEILI